MARERGPLFGLVPARAFDDPHVKATDIAVLAAISTFGERDGWCYPSQTEIAACVKLARETVCRCITRLTKLGYLEQRRMFHSDGSKASSAYSILSHTPDPRVARDDEVPDFDDVILDHIDVIGADSGGLSDPGSQQDKINLLREEKSREDSEKSREEKEKEQKKPPSSPPRSAIDREADGAEAILPAGQRQHFRRFWEAYPRKTAKGAAVRVWGRLKASPALVETILGAIGRQKRSEDWLREGGQFIPYPATWLNQHRWEDETPVADPQSARDYWPTEDELDDDVKAEIARERRLAAREQRRGA